jgi:hypothetical protein
MFKNPDNPRRIQRMAATSLVVADSSISDWPQTAENLDRTFKKKDRAASKGFTLLDAFGGTLANEILHWSSLAEAAAGHPSLVPGAGIVVSVQMEKKVHEEWVNSDKHAVGFLVQENNQYVFFDPNLGVFRCPDRIALLYALSYIFGYAYQEHERRVKKPPSPSWTVFHPKHASIGTRPPEDLGAVREHAKRIVEAACEVREQQSSDVLKEFERIVDRLIAARAAFQRIGSLADTPEDRAEAAAHDAYEASYDPTLKYAQAHSMVEEFNRIVRRAK